MKTVINHGFLVFQRRTSLSATEKILKSSKVREEVRRGQLRFLLLLNFCANIKIDPTDKVNSLLMNLVFRCPAGAMQRHRKDFSAFDLSMVLCSVCSLPGTVSEQVRVSRLICSGENRSNPDFLIVQT